MAALAISNILFTNLNSYYPIYMKERYSDLSTIHFGLIMSFFAISNLISSLVFGKYIG
jgi:hypothetical protein